MKIRTGNDIKEFNAALDKCTGSVWLIGADDEAYNMKNEEEYIEGIIRLAEDHVAVHREDGRITQLPPPRGLPPFFINSYWLETAVLDVGVSAAVFFMTRLV